jgi:geranylgeranyl diphosphate synthase, type I
MSPKLPERSEEALASYRRVLDGCRDGIIRDLAESPCHDQLVRYISRGKMLRPLLVLVATSAVGGDPAAAVVAARAIELLHTASLIHDDIIDSSDVRRGRPAMHVQLGVERALVAGDYLLLRSLTLITDAEGPDPAMRLRILGMLGSHAVECCRGQMRELEGSLGPDLEQEYVRVARGKTGSQFAAAAAIGAIMGGGSDHEVDALREYGANLGVAFQIEDDLSDLARDSCLFGTTESNSPAAGRPSLPLIYLHRYASSTGRTDFQDIIAGGGERGTRIALLQREGILDAVRARQASFVDAALTALRPIRPSDALTVLHVLPFYFVELARGEWPSPT